MLLIFSTLVSLIGIFCTFFKNGDKHDAGQKMMINAKKFKKYDQLLSKLSSMNLSPTGPVKKLVGSNGKRLKDLSGLEDKARYLCCGAEKSDKASSFYN